MNSRIRPRSLRYPASPVWRLAVVFEERRVGIDFPGVIALANDQLAMRDGEFRMKPAPFRALNAMIRPKDLRSP